MTPDQKISALRDPVLVAGLLAACCTPPAMWLLNAGGVRFNASALPAWELILLYPVLEELAFRGFVQSGLLRVPALARRWAGRLGMTGANLVTAVLFGAAHAWYQPLWYAGLVIIPGLIFGLVRDRTDRVWPAILLHVCFNLSYWLGLQVVR